MVGAELFEFLSVEVIGMRVKRVKHSVDRGFKNVIVIDLFTGNMVSFNDSKSLRDISFDIQPGEILGMVGESGAGKSLTGMAVFGEVV